VSRDVDLVQDTIDKIILEAAWLHTHAADVHEVAYGQAGGSDEPHVQTSDARDLSARIENDPDPKKPDERPRPQHTWRTLAKQIRHIEEELCALESACSRLFTAGTQDLTDPAGNKNMPKRQWAEVQAARRRRILRGEYTPTRLDGTT